MLDNIALPVTIRTFVAQSDVMTIYFPQVYVPHNYVSAQRINQSIRAIVNDLIQKQYAEQNATEFGEMIGTFEVKTNERNILSITFMNYAIIPFAVHGLTFMKSLNTNVLTGGMFQLEDLFKSSADYQTKITDVINRQIKKRKLDVFSPEGIDTISSNENFYLADQTLVIYFQQYEIAPYYVGLPLFPIPIFKLETIIKEKGPLDILFGN